ATLCTRHHAELHEGRLRIEGDADRELTFFDSADGVIDAVPNLGYASSPEDVDAILRAMGRRGGWSADLLGKATNLSAARVSCALMELELDGRVTRADPLLGLYAPVSE